MVNSDVLIFTPVLLIRLTYIYLSTTESGCALSFILDSLKYTYGIFTLVAYLDSDLSGHFLCITALPCSLKHANIVAA